MLARVILAIDRPALQRQLRRVISQMDVIVDVAKGEDGRQWDRVARESADFVLVSRALIPHPVSDTIRLLRQLPDAPGVVVLSEAEDSEDRAKLLAAGCEAVLFAGLSAERFRDVLATLLAKRRHLTEDSLSVRRFGSRPRLADFVSASQAMQAFMHVVRRVVSSDVSLLILGETGVGKEWLARAIHTESSRSEGPFITVNCGALPETLLESELFGHEEGAFTGATRSRRGWFELAHRGTVFLDEIGEMPHHLQVKLLRVLQEHEIQRVGSEKPVVVDVRVIAATNRDLVAEVAAKRFRQDLYYRLSVVSLTVPPLRERREDIPAIVESYIGYLRPRIGSQVTGITDDSMEALAEYAWPGNVRELINVIERAMLLCSGHEITLNDLPETISRKGAFTNARILTMPNSDQPAAFPDEWLQRPLREVRREFLDSFERAYLAGLLRSTGGKVGETAKRAGMEPRSLFEKMRRYGLRKEDFRALPGA